VSEKHPWRNEPTREPDSAYDVVHKPASPSWNRFRSTSLSESSAATTRVSIPTACSAGKLLLEVEITPLKPDPGGQVDALSSASLTATGCRPRLGSRPAYAGVEIRDGRTPLASPALSV
jgi:hypothetical protein